MREEFRKRAVPMMFDEIQKSMKDFRVNFDVWFHENSLYADGKVDAAIEELKSRGDIFDKDGATWFESTKHGDDKDRVIIKSNGEFAYFAADIATTGTSAIAPKTRPTWPSTCLARTTTLHRPHDGHVRGVRR